MIYLCLSIGRRKLGLKKNKKKTKTEAMHKGKDTTKGNSKDKDKGTNNDQD
jgi:hypothetical protein